MSVLEGIERELSALPVDLRESGTAAVARAMADRIDRGVGSPSECGKVLLQALDTLRALAPPKKEEDGVDALAKRFGGRRLKLVGGSTASDLPRS